MLVSSYPGPRHGWDRAKFGLLSIRIMGLNEISGHGVGRVQMVQPYEVVMNVQSQVGVFADMTLNVARTSNNNKQTNLGTGVLINHDTLMLNPTDFDVYI